MQQVKADPEIFARNLRHLMNRERLDLNGLAFKLRMSSPRVRRWLDAECFPKESAMVQLCELFEYYDIFKLITQPVDFRNLSDAAKT